MKLVKLGLIVATFVAAGASVAIAQAKVEEKVVGRAAGTTEAYLVSPKGVHYAVLTSKGSRNVMVVDGAGGGKVTRRISG